MRTTVKKKSIGIAEVGEDDERMNIGDNIYQRSPHVLNETN